MHKEEANNAPQKQRVTSIFSNVFYFVRLMFSVSPLFVITDLSSGVLEQLPGRLISVIGMKYVIDVVESGERLERIWGAVALIAAVLAVSHLLSWLYREFYWNMAREKLTLGLSEKLYAKAKSSIVLRPFPSIVSLVRELQSPKAPSPIVSTLWGIVSRETLLL